MRHVMNLVNLGVNYVCLTYNSKTNCVGEGDEESFDTLDEAKGWCQEMINNRVSEIAVLTITND